MRRSKGYRSKTRALLRKKPRDRGKLPLSKLLRDYKPGEKIVIKIDPAIHKGMPHRRYHGRIGVIRERRGRAYVVNLAMGERICTLIVRPEHLEPWETTTSVAAKGA